MSQRTFEIRGRVVDSSTGRGAPDLRVMIADAEDSRPNMLFRAVTNSEGEYCIELTQEDAAQLFDPSPSDIWTFERDMYASVYNDGVLLVTTTVQFAMDDFARGYFPHDITVDTGSSTSVEFTVHGRLVDTDGLGSAAARMRVNLVEVGSRSLVETGNTDADGYFDLTYPGSSSSTATATNLSIEVLALDPVSGAELSRTPVIVDPAPRHHVDLLIGEVGDYVGRPEYEAVAAALDEHTPSGTVLTADDLEVMVKATGLDPMLVATGIQARRIEDARGIPAPAAYALMRAGLPADVPGQLAQPRQSIRRALQTALDSNLVDATLPDGNPFDVESLVSAYSTEKSNAIQFGTDTTLLNIIQSSGASANTTPVFINRLSEHEGTMEELWENLRADTTFPNSDVDALEFTMRASELSNGHLDMVTALNAERIAGNLNTFTDLAGWDGSDWTSFVATHGAPTDLPGDQAEREAAYAVALSRFVEEKHPTQVVARRIERDEPAAEVPAFLDAHPEFDIEKTVVAAFADSNPTAFDGYTTDVQERVKAVQRVYALAPRYDRYEVARTLLDEGVESAAQVVHIGRAAFIQRFSQAFDGVHGTLSGEQVAKSVYAAAVQKHAFSVATMAQYGASFNTIQIPAIQAKVLQGDEGPGAATLANLFGSLDYCECKHCRSMYGPAAYFVELLSSLEGMSYLDEVTSRRADLTALELSCINTNTPLPYIDIVNEVLEQVSLELQVEGNLDNLQLEARQTTWTAEELRLNPEPTGFMTGGISPYDGPANASFPWSLPLDLPAEETRAYLQQLGLDRAELQELFPAADSTSALGISAEAARLGMTHHEFNMIAGGPQSPTVSDAWGTANVAALGSNLRELLDRAEISYDELTHLLELRFVRRNSERIIYSTPDGDPSCDLDDRAVEAFSIDTADRLHRFVRLSRILDMDWVELDRVIASLGSGTVDATFLARLAGMQRVQARLGLDSDEACAFWDDIDAYPYDEPFERSPGLYARLFQDRRVFAEPDPSFAFSALSGPLEESHHPTLRAALRVNDADLSLLLAREAPPAEDPDPPAEHRNIGVLSQMYRTARLCRALRLPIADFYRLLDLSGLSPFTDPAATLSFCDFVDEIEEWGTPVVDIDYLCRQESVEAYGRAPSDEALEDIEAELLEAYAAVDQSIDETGAPLATLDVLAQRVDAGDEESTPSLVELITNSVDTETDEAELALIASYYPTTVANEPDWNASTEDEGYAGLDERILWMLTQVAARVREDGRNAAALEVLAGITGQHPSVVAALSELVAQPEEPTEEPPPTPLAVLTDETQQAQWRTTLAALIKRAAFLASLRVAPQDLDWYFGDDSALQGMDLLTVTPVDAENVFSGWNRVRRGQVNARMFAEEENPVPNLDDQAFEEIALSTGLNASDVAYVVGTSSLADPSTLERLREVAQAVKATGVAAETLEHWATAAPSTTAADIKQALRSRYSETQWPKIIQPISDRLRERRRDALLGYILQNSEFGTTEDIYEHFLLDPEMNACMLTSRIKLGISALQLFIQRALLSLEPNVELPATFERDWDWKKNYRVWEANRKVFFYPENWIEPELRVGKSPFFEELEAHLQQGELTTEHVELGFDAYVTKLHEVANLEVLDLHRTHSPGHGSLIHIIARTRSQPAKFFYRRQVNGTHWDPWEEISAPIDSRHVLLRAMGSRMFLMWLDFHEHSTPPPSPEANAPQPFFHYKISWCERVRDGWTSPRSTDLIPPASIRIPALSSTRKWHVLWGGLTASPSGNARLTVECWYDASLTFSLSYDPCRDEFVERTEAVFPRPELAQSLVPSREFIPRSDDVSLYRTHPETGTRFSFPVIENRSTSTKITHSHQNGVWGTQPDGTYPAVLDLGNENIFCTPISSTTEFLPPPPPEGYQPPPDGNLFELASIQDHDDSGDQGPPSLSWAVETISGPKLSGTIDALQTPAEMAVQGWHPGWRFEVFHHPHTCAMLNALRGGDGANSLLSPSSGSLWRQQHSTPIPPGRDPGQLVDRVTDFVAPHIPANDFDFSGHGAYSVYNWEIFYHAPLLVADRYRREGKFEEADRWYRYIFDPRVGTVHDDEGTLVDGPERFWRVKPLYNETRDGEVDVIQAIFSNEGLDAEPELVHNFIDSIFRWAISPFDPHAIAAVRSGTYRWVAVRKYLDNLIDWADSLFRRDTIESINEATQLYLLAHAILGRRPERLSEVEPTTSTYQDLGLAGLFGGIVELEGVHPSNGGLSPFDAFDGGDGPEPPPLWWYFCLPANPQLLEYWDKVADRLFKIRNCQNIEGVTRQLALFQPPIDPALLVRARAAGLDLGDVLNNLNAPMPAYRYRAMAGRATDLCNDLKSLGGALLTALEKRDAEELSRLRARHETAVLQRVTQIREQQLEDAETQLEILAASRRSAQTRKRYYETREKVSGAESKQIRLTKKAGRFRTIEQGIGVAAGVAGLLPDFNVGTGFFMDYGGLQFSRVLGAIGSAFGAVASQFERKSQLAGMAAGHERRWDDWQHQLEVADLEIKNIDKQIIAAEIRKAMAEKELENHERQIEQSQEVQAFYKDKFTNKELYDWMLGELSRLYYQAYKLAFDMAKKAERAMQFELETDDTFIEFGYWDSLKKGLMAGERLHLDIKRMESAYLEKDKRELELTKRISLRQVAPEALLRLRETGECDFSIPEVLFDLDHAGHYLRRIRAVRVTIPAVAGPQTSIGATLTLQRDDLRVEPSDTADVVRTTYGGTKRIATSHAREDGGMFELNFRDERYLPFEGAGVASDWSLRLPTEIRQFDYNTISDVELRIDYTARDGGSGYRTTVESGLREAMENALSLAGEEGIALVLSAKKDLAVDWERFLRPADGELGSSLELPLTLEQFPYVLRGLAPTVTSIDVALVSSDTQHAFGGGDATLNAPDTQEFVLQGQGNAISTSVPNVAVSNDSWWLDIGPALNVEDPDAIDDLWIIVRFAIDA